MRSVALSIFLTICLALCAAAESEFVADGASLGSTVIWFTPTTIDTIFTGTMDISGEIGFTGHAGLITATGDSHGAGVADGMTFATELWVLFAASGRLDSGDEVYVRGGLTVHSDTIDMATMSMGSGPGSFIAIIDVQTASYAVVGTLESDASGQMVAPDDPSTMQVEGGATFAFTGDALSLDGPIEELLPWDIAGWPQELHAELIALLTGVPVEEEDPGEESAAGKAGTP